MVEISSSIIQSDTNYFV